jgi:hypothetical protein
MSCVRDYVCAFLRDEGWKFKLLFVVVLCSWGPVGFANLFSRLLSAESAQSALSPTSAVSAITFGAKDACAELQGASLAEDLNVERDVFLLRLRQFVESAGSEDGRRSFSGLSGHCLWPQASNSCSPTYDGKVHPLGVLVSNATVKEKACLPLCTWPGNKVVTPAKYEVIPFLHVAVDGHCYELHRLDMCLFALRGGAGFVGVRQRVLVRTWLREASWILDQDRNGMKLVDALPFLDGGYVMHGTNHMWSVAFGC